MGRVFLAEVTTSRGNRLKSGVDFGTSEVWGGLEAKEIGLVDALSTVDEYVNATWGLKQYDFGPNPDSLGLLPTSLREAMSSVIDSLAADALRVR